MKSSKSFTIGTRGSPLALVQAHWVQGEIQERFPEYEVRIHKIKTLGDVRKDHPLGGAGRKGYYTKEIENELAAGTIDCAVHSMKDLPSIIESEFLIAAVTEREDPRDAFISDQYSGLLELPKGATIGTSSLRRLTQLKNFRPDLEIVPLRGNIDTRLQKMRDEKIDAIILAVAGLKRLDRAEEITERLEPSLMVPAAGQGALAIEIRAHDKEAHTLVNGLNHLNSAIAIRAERACVRRLSGGCEVPITAHAVVAWNRLEMIGLVATPDGRELMRDQIEGDPKEPETTGERLAESLLKQGAQRIIDQILAHVQNR